MFPKSYPGGFHLYSEPRATDLANSKHTGDPEDAAKHFFTFSTPTLPWKAPGSLFFLACSLVFVLVSYPPLLITSPQGSRLHPGRLSGASPFTVFSVKRLYDRKPFSGYFWQVMGRDEEGKEAKNTILLQRPPEKRWEGKVESILSNDSKTTWG